MFQTRPCTFKMFGTRPDTGIKKETNMKPTKIGVIGCGTICGIYFTSLRKFPTVEVAACADIDIKKAKAKAAEFSVPRACTVDELLADKDISLVVNLTIPVVHAEVSIRALNAGKHVYSEKPLATTRKDAARVIEVAKRKKLRIGCAPDTVLGGGIQTCKKIIDDGWIGKPVAATAFMMGHGPEAWHPNPFFFYEPGAGPLFDVGPYYVAALITLLGPVKTVASMARMSFKQRLATSKEHFGKTIEVKTPTHVAGTLEFANGAIGTLITSFDVWGTKTPRIEIYGSEATLAVPDPNTFGGPIQIRRMGIAEFVDIPVMFPYAENFRGLGAADIVHAVMNKRDHRANGEIAYHSVDVMESLLEASKAQKHLKIKSSCKRPALMPLGRAMGMLD